QSRQSSAPRFILIRSSSTTTRVDINWPIVFSKSAPTAAGSSYRATDRKALAGRNLKCLQKARRTSSSKRLAHKSPLKLVPTAEQRALLCIESAANLCPPPGYRDCRLHSSCQETTNRNRLLGSTVPLFRHVPCRNRSRLVRS